MSAYLVSDKHISILVNAHRVGDFGGLRIERFLAGAELDGRGLEASLFNMLRNENLASLAARYPSDKDDAGVGVYMPREDLGMPFRPSGPSLVSVLKAISCYEYQACEHEGWSTSMAREYCNALRAHLCHYLPGYRDADGWSF